MAVFDNKIFNAEVFGKYVDTIPRVKQNALLRAGVFRSRSELKTMLAEQTGGNYITLPMFGRIGGDPVNYDGATDISCSSTKSYSQSMVVVGRAKGWEELDFSTDVTGQDFLEKAATQISEYWDDVDQGILLSILKGIFGVTAGSFNTKNTYDATGNTASAGKMAADTLNNAIQQAAGANKNIFTLAIMHSAVATHLENLQLLEYFKATDANGLQRDVGLATWNGRTVMIDDDVPTEDVAESSSGQGDGYTKYTTYLLGRGAFDYCDIGATVPYEPDRDPASKGGKSMIYSRQRKLWAPYGFSFTKFSMASASPTNADLGKAVNWTLVNDGASSKSYIDTKAIPIARIYSKG